MIATLAFFLSPWTGSSSREATAVVSSFAPASAALSVPAAGALAVIPERISVPGSHRAQAIMMLPRITASDTSNPSRLMGSFLIHVFTGSFSIIRLHEGFRDFHSSIPHTTLGKRRLNRRLFRRLKRRLRGFCGLEGLVAVCYQGNGTRQEGHEVLPGEDFRQRIGTQEEYCLCECDGICAVAPAPHEEAMQYCKDEHEVHDPMQALPVLPAQEAIRQIVRSEEKRQRQQIGDHTEKIRRGHREKSCLERNCEDILEPIRIQEVAKSVHRSEIGHHDPELTPQAHHLEEKAHPENLRNRA